MKAVDIANAEIAGGTSQRSGLFIRAQKSIAATIAASANAAASGAIFAFKTKPYDAPNSAERNIISRIKAPAAFVAGHKNAGRTTDADAQKTAIVAPSTNGIE